MKTSYLLFVAFLQITNCLSAQNNETDKFFLLKPSEIKTGNPGIQEYNVSLKWQNLDAINGNKINCNAVKATYLVGLEDDLVGWKEVTLSEIGDVKQEQFEGTFLPSFNDFTYNKYDTGFLTEGFYKNIAPEHRDLAKWLVSDAFQMQGLAWYVFDSLEFNREFIPKILDNHDIKFENWVTFTSRWQKLIWSGITSQNNEICAVVKFESYYNPVETNNEVMALKGRSLYWGEMWISLEDKEVEYATMFEDVVFKLKTAAFPQEQIIDLQREVIFDKVQ